MNSVELCNSISNGLPELFRCSPAPDEGVRVRTPLMYPDGGIVDVFVLKRGDFYQITDFGETLGWLRMQSVSKRRSKKQNLMVEDVCHTLGIKLSQGQMMLRSETNENIGERVLRVAQAAVRVSDLWFTLRTRAVETMADEVNEWLSERKIPFERDVRKRGRSGREWNIDYRTRVNEKTSLVFLLSTGSRATAPRITEHVLASCIDLSHFEPPKPQLVSVFDDTQDIWREEDFKLVEEGSKIACWSRPDKFEQMLTESNSPDIS